MPLPVAGLKRTFSSSAVLFLRTCATSLFGFGLKCRWLASCSSGVAAEGRKAGVALERPCLLYHGRVQGYADGGEGNAERLFPKPNADKHNAKNYWDPWVGMGGAFRYTEKARGVFGNREITQ